MTNLTEVVNKNEIIAEAVQAFGFNNPSLIKGSIGKLNLCVEQEGRGASLLRLGQLTCYLSNLFSCQVNIVLSHCDLSKLPLASSPENIQAFYNESPDKIEFNPFERSGLHEEKQFEIAEQVVNDFKSGNFRVVSQGESSASSEVGSCSSSVKPK